MIEVSRSWSIYANWQWDHVTEIMPWWTYPNISIATWLCHDVHVAIIKKHCNLILRPWGHIYSLLPAKALIAPTVTSVKRVTEKVPSLSELISYQKTDSHSMLGLTIRDDALYSLYLLLSLDDVKRAKRRHVFSSIVHALKEYDVWCNAMDDCIKPLGRVI
jgi:hypothetical protein